MAYTAIHGLRDVGQSIWFDNISRALIESGRVKELIDLGVSGMTSNPTIFDRAVSSGSDYDEQIRQLKRLGKSTFEMYDDLTVRDIQDAADIFKPVYDESDGLDGYVSLEINPHLATRTAETIEEGRRLHNKVNRPNVMFKVPAADEGYEAIETFLAEGMNINVTLIFSLQQYERTAQAFLNGMTRLSETQGDLSRTSSVASVFVSRVDTAVDRVIDDLVVAENDEAVREKLLSLRGKAAVANAKLIYQKSLEMFSGEAYGKLKANGARLQRVLWGSTGTKDPSYSDIKYVEELIGKDTVNTAPEKTLEAFLDHGSVRETVTSDLEDAQEIIESLSGFGIDIDEVCARLLRDGIVAFQKSFDSLLESIQAKAG
jgi:transaldolase